MFIVFKILIFRHGLSPRTKITLVILRSVRSIELIDFLVVYTLAQFSV